MTDTDAIPRSLLFTALLCTAVVGLPSGAQEITSYPPMDARVESARICVDSLVQQGGWISGFAPAAPTRHREIWCHGTPVPEPDDSGVEDPCKREWDSYVELHLDVEDDAIDWLSLHHAVAPDDSGWGATFYGTTTELGDGSALGTGGYALATVTVTRTDGEPQHVPLVPDPRNRMISQRKCKRYLMFSA